jgi:SulP family sulfate permease
VTFVRSCFKPTLSLKDIPSEVLGGFAAMLVALPSSIAFGIIIFAPLGAGAAQGALAGIVGAAALGIVAPFFGGTSRLVTSPCAPSAALLSAFVAGVMASGSVPADMIPLLVAIVAIGAGLVQLAIGLLGGGVFIKYIPYPVVAGYLGGVGVLIFLGQIPRFLGLPSGTVLLKGVLSPDIWRWESMVIGGATILVMLLLPKIVKAVPASIAALGAGIAVYFAIAFFRPSLLTLKGNPLVIGTIQSSPSDIISVFTGNISHAAELSFSTFSMLLLPVISLGILLSIDTLKTCVILDALTGARHDSNRELIGQGAANMVCGTVGGVPGSGAMAGTLVNSYSGGRTRMSGVMEGVFALFVLLVFSRFVEWIPVASLAGVLLVVAVRMIDRKSIELLRHRSTRFDFAVIFAVVVAAITTNLITAAGVGIAFAIVLFLRNQILSPVVRRRTTGNIVFSKKTRPSADHAVLEQMGSHTLLVELQGQLFFGTTDQMYCDIEPFISKSRFVVLDMRRVLSVDFTAARMLTQLREKISQNNGVLLFASVPINLPSGQNVRHYLERLGFSGGGDGVMFFPETDAALEWVEEFYIREAMPDKIHRRALELAEFEFFSGIPSRELAVFAEKMLPAAVTSGEKVFSMDDAGDGRIYFIRKGSVRIEIPLDKGTVHHLATFSRGAFFGEMAFLDNESRSADARADGDVELFVLRRAEFESVIEQCPDIAGIFFERLALEVSKRLRLNVIELKALEDN